MAEIVLGRLKFKWQGVWTTGTAYIKDDVVRFGSSNYVCVLNHTSATWTTDLSAVKWELMLEGGMPGTDEGDIIYYHNDQHTRLPIGSEGQALIVSDGAPAWLGLATAQAIYYVKADGNDTNDGSNLNQAFKSIRHACDVVTGPATIYVKGGLYSEILPIKVGANVTIVGDGQRITGVQPLNAVATSADVSPRGSASTSTTIDIADGSTTGGPFQVNCVLTGTQISGTVTVTAVAANTPTAGFTRLTVSFTSQVVVSESCTITSNYSEGTMWQLNDGATLNKMYFSGMTGFVPNLAAPEDITAADIAGVFIAFDPLNPIINKSPYIIECASFSVGGIGAVVDGDVHATGLKSMVFHGYTTINSDGVGYWVNGQGKSEIVSCFTYYCWFGYASTNGGKIRALNGNNSYGKYGVVSRGFDTTETAVTGALYGDMITYNIGSLDGILTAGDTVQGGTSGATGIITNAQPGLNKFYYISTNATAFQVGETITTSDSATMVIAAGGVTGQKGFVLVADGFSSLPKPGGSISVAGDTTSYIIQSVSGSYSNATSVLSIILANEKIDPSTNDIAVTVRYAFSQSRLTGHDFLSIGTGNKIQTNYPGIPTQAASQANEVVEQFPGRVFYVSTDQDGNFRVGDYFRVDQATGRATLNASAFDLSGLTSLQLGRIGGYVGEAINEFSSDGTLSGNSNEAVPTEAAVKEYFTQISTNVVPATDDILTLGTPTNRWNHIYIGPGSMTIGSLTITDNAGTLEVKSAETDVVAPANINSISNGTSNVTVADNGAVTVTANGNLGLTVEATGRVDIAGVLSGPAIFTIDPAAVGDDTGVVVIKGNLQVDGTTTTVNSTTVELDVKNLILAVGAANDAAADGAGITVDSADGDKTWNWVDATDAWTSSEHIDLAATKKIKIAGSAGADNKFLQTTSSGMVWADAAVTVSDITTSGTYYPLFTTSTSGTVTTANVTSTKFSFNPSTGTLAVTGVVQASNSVVVDGGAYGNVTTTQFASVFATGSGPNPRAIMQVRGADGTAGIGMQAYSGINGQIYASTGITFTTGSTLRDKDYPTGGTTRAIMDSTGLAVTGIVSATDNVTVGSAVAATNVDLKLNGVASKAQRIIFQESGVEKWLIGQGAASETSAFEIYNSTGTMALSINKTTSLATFGAGLSCVSLTETSSIALKENVNPITNALDAIMSLVGVTYDRKNGSSKNEAGLIAEEVDKVLPNLVSHREDGSAEGIQYTKLTAYLIEAIKTLKAEIDELKGNK